MAKSKYKRHGKAKFVMLDSYVKLSPAWKALTPIERNTYIEVKWRYDGFNNGRIGLSCRELAGELGMGRDTAARALHRLTEVGFIAKQRQSAFNVKNRLATEWRLTEYRCDVTGDLPTKDFMRWGVESKSQSHQSDTQSRLSDYSTAGGARKPLHGRPPRTVEQASAFPQSHPSDTYISTIRATASTTPSLSITVSPALLASRLVQRAEAPQRGPTKKTSAGGRS